MSACKVFEEQLSSYKESTLEIFNLMKSLDEKLSSIKILDDDKWHEVYSLHRKIEKQTKSHLGSIEFKMRYRNTMYRKIQNIWGGIIEMEKNINEISVLEYIRLYRIYLDDCKEPEAKEILEPVFDSSYKKICLVDMDEEKARNLLENMKTFGSCRMALNSIGEGYGRLTIGDLITCYGFEGLMHIIEGPVFTKVFQLLNLTYKFKRQHYYEKMTHPFRCDCERGTSYHRCIKPGYFKSNY